MSAQLQQELAYLLRETGRDEASLLAEALQEGIHTLFSKHVRDACSEGKLGRRKALRLLGPSEVEEIEAAWRGVFSPLYHPKVLFSQQIEVRTADLPRWKPRITIDRRTLMRGDDE